MYSPSEAAELLGVSKVTIYAKLKKYDSMVVMKQGKKMITEDLINLIKQDLQPKEILIDEVVVDEVKEHPKVELSMELRELINSNKALIDTLQKQLEEKDKQIEGLHKLIENNQVLLKQKAEDPLLLEERFNNFESKLDEVKERMEQRKDKKSFWDRLKK